MQVQDLPTQALDPAGVGVQDGPAARAHVAEHDGLREGVQAAQQLVRGRRLQQAEELALQPPHLRARQPLRV